MLFQSIEFLIFLPVVFVLYWFIFKDLRAQNLLILVASYVFYGWWDWRFLLLIAFTSTCSYVSGLYIHKFSKRIATYICGGNIIINIVILCIFKYFNFFVESFAGIMDFLGMPCDVITINVILPVGISFYTFQALSYTIDIFRQKIQPSSDVVAFFAFLSFFPQLVAGPIERASNLLPQFAKKRTFDYETAVDGCRQMLFGYFKKVVVADNCAIWANNVFDNYENLSGSTLFFGAVYFTFQIYGDFSGYSDIAIGCSKLFGIKLMRNFNVPYFSRNIAEFWKRWHISLNTWFVDYVYIPLGGSRVNRKKTVRNVFVIFLLSGLWHGANWTFVVWGLYHAVLFLPLIWLGKNKMNSTSVVAEKTLFPNAMECAQMVSTFLLVLIGWIFFRSPSIYDALMYLKQMFCISLLSMPTGLDRTCVYFILVMIVIEWIERKQEHALSLVPINKIVRWGGYAVLFAVIWVYMKGETQFIYFQF